MKSDIPEFMTPDDHDPDGSDLPGLIIRLANSQSDDSDPDDSESADLDHANDPTVHRGFPTTSRILNHLIEHTAGGTKLNVIIVKITAAPRQLSHFPSSDMKKMFLLIPALLHT
jgi:hypothetical protein